jgi:anaerobic magnesium-protoporphyrin IX monomethyl ester cyclase
VEAQLGAKKNWESSDDLSMMFQGAYTSEFYRALRDALHLEVNAGESPEVDERWRKVTELRHTCANERPTLLWTSC